jgi:hypothetical protein
MRDERQGIRDEVRDVVLGMGEESGKWDVCVCGMWSVV